MRWMLAILTVFALGTGGLWFYSWARPKRPSGAPILRGSLDPEKHRVTTEMEEALAARAGIQVPHLTLEGSEGSSRDLAAMANAGPTVLIFIKDQCPCSTAAEPYFARLHSAYGSRVRFLGIIDGDRATAARWVRDHSTPFPVAHDPGVDTMRALGVTNSAQVAVIETGGKVRALWPGFSKEMIAELSRLIASLAGIQAVTIDTRDAPEELYTGCPFEL